MLPDFFWAIRAIYAKIVWKIAGKSPSLQGKNREGMTRTSEDILEKYRDVLKKILTQCAERRDGRLPMGRLFIEGYKMGLSDASDKDMQMPDESKIWHYIEMEGYPPEEERCLWLVECDGYYDIEEGCYENSRVRLDYYSRSYRRVVAWHRLPELPEYKK